MDRVTIDLAGATLAATVGTVVRNARMAIGWSQKELAVRASSSQAVISRLESGSAPVVDVRVLNKVFRELGLDAKMILEGHHLRDRERQADGVHAKLNGFVARHLGQWGWRTPTEVPIGDQRPKGWIDLLGYRESDKALLVEESKADLPDFGALQRSVAFYEREAWDVARGLGWEPRTLNVLVVMLDSGTIARRLADNRDLVRIAFPTLVPGMAAWLEDPTAPRPVGWAIGTCDPASRKGAWLRPTTLGSRRTAPAYANYADASSKLLTSTSQGSSGSSPGSPAPPRAPSAGSRTPPPRTPSSAGSGPRPSAGSRPVSPRPPPAGTRPPSSRPVSPRPPPAGTRSPSSRAG